MANRASRVRYLISASRATLRHEFAVVIATNGRLSHVQESLFYSIRKGNFEFPEKDWSYISDHAKDLIRKLLVKDAHRRLNALEVLEHPWINPGPKDYDFLATPEVIKR